MVEIWWAQWHHQTITIHYSPEGRTPQLAACLSTPPRSSILHLWKQQYDHHFPLTLIARYIVGVIGVAHTLLDKVRRADDSRESQARPFGHTCHVLNQSTVLSTEVVRWRENVAVLKKSGRRGLRTRRREISHDLPVIKIVFAVICSCNFANNAPNALCWQRQRKSPHQPIKQRNLLRYTLRYTFRQPHR